MSIIRDGLMDYWGMLVDKRIIGCFKVNVFIIGI